MKLQHTTGQIQKILPTQIQYLNFLKLQNHELLQTIKEEMEDNPFLEEDVTENEEVAGDELDQDLSYVDSEEYEDGYSIREVGVNDSRIHDEKRDIMNNCSRMNTTREDVIEEVRSMSTSPQQFDLACYLINSLDSDGYLRSSTDEIADSLSFSRQKMIDVSEVDAALEIVQACEPAGIGARDLRECLMIQLFRKEKKTRADVLAYDILDEHFHVFCERGFAELQGIYEVEQEKILAALKSIKALNARPAYLDDVPMPKVQAASDIDFIITENERGELVGELASSFSGFIKFSSDAQDQLSALNRKKSKKVDEQQRETFLKSKSKHAKWFMDCISQREQSMKQVIDAIVAMQSEYFTTGDKQTLKPMVLQNIADVTGLDISTISRITSTRAADTPIGKVMLKDMFTQGVQANNGVMISNANVKDVLAGIIAQEDKNNPYTDEHLSRLLSDKGIKIARRTVLKYREQMNIPAAKYRMRAAA